MKISRLAERERWLIGLANIYQDLLLRVARWRRCRQPVARTVGRICLYYRICDQGYVKDKASYMSKEACLANAVRRFPLSRVEWCVLADGVCDDTYRMIVKYVPQERVRRVRVGHGAGTFRMAYEEALQQPDDTLVYFLEDDYLHCPGSLEALLAVAATGMADYLTLYDHPDKYQWDSLNPYVIDGGEKTRVFFLGHHHWKATNSTTMTFAAFADTLRRDKHCFWRWTATRHPYDFHIFLELRKIYGRTLISPIPSMSTHGDTHSLALGVDWEQQV